MKSARGPSFEARPAAQLRRKARTSGWRVGCGQRSVRSDHGLVCRFRPPDLQ